MTNLPSPWQQALGQALADALARSAAVHAPVHDAPAADARPLRSRWLVARRPAGVPSTALQSLARAQANDPAGRARATSLMARCLQHYREQIRPDDDVEDDAGVALACFLAACVQAQDGRAVTPQRWQAVHDWVDAWAADGLDWASVPRPQQADFFERMASLGVAIGEWTVVASRQGEAAMRSAQLLAQSSLRAQLGLALPALAAVVRSLDASAAADPGWGDPELPKAPTTAPQGERL